jgi:hypothetical protein
MRLCYAYFGLSWNSIPPIRNAIIETNRGKCKAGAGCAIAGSFLLLIGTYLHPATADPNDVTQAFAAYAADKFWVASHLMQLLGVVLPLAALIILARHFETERTRVWLRLATAGTITSIALAAALRPVDGTL